MRKIVDVITSINGKSVFSAARLRTRARLARVGHPITVEYFRNSVRAEVCLRIAVASP